MKKFALWSAAGLLLLCGCETLPPGEPPVGNLVTNPEVQKWHTPLEVEQQLTNLLIAASLNDFPGQGLAVQSDDATLLCARQAVNNTALITGIKRQNTAKWRLKTYSIGAFWNFELFCGNQKIWHHRFAVASKAATSPADSNRN